MSVPKSEGRTWEEVLAETPPEPLPTVAFEEQTAPVEPAAVPMKAKVEMTDAFPEEWKEDFEGLLYLGYLEAEVTIPFHAFTVRTLLPATKIELSMMLTDLQTSVGYGLAYKCAVVAAALEMVDDRPIIVASKVEPALRQKYNYVINSWYEPVIDVLYRAVDDLEARQLMVMRELGIIGQ